jgi:hydrogenase-1 operon protein HyaE
MMTLYSPLTETLLNRHGYPLVSEADLDAFGRTARFGVLFFQGDWQRLGESGDVAVILPELMKAFDGTFRAAVVERASERKLQGRYRFPAFPALVLLRDGEYLGAISRVLDWNDYLLEIAEILQREPSVPPPFRLPEPPAMGGDEAPHIH